MQYFHKFILSWNSTCFGQFVCPSSGVYSLYTQQWCMSYRVVDSFRDGSGWSWTPSWSCSKAVYNPVWHKPLLSVQWINSWWWTDELSETCRVSWQNKFVKLVHLVYFIIKKSVAMHGHTNVNRTTDHTHTHTHTHTPTHTHTHTHIYVCVCVCVCVCNYHYAVSG